MKNTQMQMQAHGRGRAAGLLATFAVFLSVGAAHAAAPSQDLSSYVLFALSSLRSKGLTMTDGGVGVNAAHGTLFSNGPIFVPDSPLVAQMVRIDERSVCGTLFAKEAVGGGSKCGPKQSFTPPIIADPVTACGYPTVFPACNANAPVEVAAGVTRTLSPGAYGDVHVTGGSNQGTLILLPGTYTFCSLQVARTAQLLAAGPANVNVTGNLTFGTASRIAPQNGSISAADLRFHVAGRQARFARRSNVHARLCAPHAMLRITTGSTVEGTFLADTIHTEKLSGTGAGPGNPCLGNHCGDGVVNCGEVCDPNAPAVPCPGDDSAGGAFRICAPGCGSFDDTQCHGGSTTTTTASVTTTTTTSGSTTTTLDTCLGNHCGDGKVNCGELCDPNATPVPCASSTDGAMLDDSSTGGFRLCVANCTAFDDSQCSGGTTTTTSAPTTSTTTTTTTSGGTTSTTLDPCVGNHCGDGKVNCDELCDPAAEPVACPDSAETAFLEAGSAGGGFRICNATCDGFDDTQCNATTTTTTHTTTSTTTTSTTLNVCSSPAAHCGNGVVDCDEACDPNAPSQPLCGAGSPGGGFVGCTADCQIDRTECAVEICGNCTDDDGDGLVDFEDPDCCSQPQTVAMELRKARIRPAGNEQSKLRIRSRLGQKPAFGANLAKQDVFLQISPEEGTGGLCAQIPSAKFTRKSARQMLFRDKKLTLASAKGLQRMVIRITKSGKVRMIARGKKVQVQTPREGSVKVIIGLHQAGAADNTGNQCSTVLQRFIGTPRLGGVRAP